MTSKYIGILFLVVGVTLAWWGYNIYDSATSQISRAFSGDTPFEAWVGMVGGGVCIMLGLFKLK